MLARIAQRHARTVPQRRTFAARVAVGRQLGFDVAHRVDAVSTGVVEVVRFPEGRTPVVAGPRVLQDTIGKRFEEQARPERRSELAKLANFLPHLVVAQRDPRPRTALADGRGEHELEHDVGAEALARAAQVVLELLQVQPRQHAVQHHRRTGVEQPFDPGDGLVVRGFADAEDGRAGGRVKRVQRHDGALQAGRDGAGREVGLGKRTAVRVRIPRHAERRQMLDDRPEAGMDGRLAAGHDDAAKAQSVQEVGAPQQLLAGMKEQRRVAGVAAHRAAVVALLAETEESAALRRHRRLFRNEFLEETGRALLAERRRRRRPGLCVVRQAQRLVLFAISPRLVVIALGGRRRGSNAAIELGDDDLAHVLGDQTDDQVDDPLLVAAVSPVRTCLAILQVPVEVLDDEVDDGVDDAFLVVIAAAVAALVAVAVTAPPAVVTATALVAPPVPTAAVLVAAATLVVA